MRIRSYDYLPTIGMGHRRISHSEAEGDCHDNSGNLILPRASDDAPLARAGCKADMRGIKSPPAGLRFHDLRHHAITELAEARVSDQTIMAIAGHVSPMLARYSHVRSEARRQAVAALSAKPTRGLV